MKKKQDLFWEKHFFDKHQSKKWTFDDFDFVATREDTGWTISHNTDKGEPVSEHFFMNTDGYLKLYPILPDRPLIINPQTSLKIFPGCHIKIFVTIPVFTGVYSHHNGKDTLVKEISFTSLSSTWMGNFQIGELCYSWSSPVFTDFNKAVHLYNFALCCLNINNNTGTMLALDNFLLDTRYLQIFKGKKSLWCNDVIITFRGPEQNSQADFRNHSPQHELTEKIPIEPRLNDNGNFFKRTFDFFKTIYET